jgi:hypothetical protein
MKKYENIRYKLYKCIVLFLLKRNILSLDEGVNCLIEIDNQINISNDLINSLIMVKHKGLTSTKSVRRL